MANSHPFSIYLIKQTSTFEDAVPDSDAVGEFDAFEGGQLHIFRGESRATWWSKFLDIEDPFTTSPGGAILLLQEPPVEGEEQRRFAVTFGHGSYRLDEAHFEHDFGLLVTLNAVDPGALKSADSAAPTDARQRRTQAATGGDLTFLDFDADSEIIRTITGAVKPEFAELAKSVTGSASVKLSMKIELAQLPAVCGTLLKLYKREDYRLSFPSIDKIKPIKDPAIVQELDARLMELFNARSEDLALVIPQIVDYQENRTCCRFLVGKKRSEVYPDITIEHLYAVMDELRDDDTVVSILERSKTRVQLTDADGNPGATFSIYNSLVTEVEYDAGHMCCLYGGKWYRADKEFVDGLNEYLAGKCISTGRFIDYDHDGAVNGKTVYSEENYNIAAARHKGGVCLDRRNISPAGQSSLEPCDFLYISLDHDDSGVNFVHVKISTRSAALSHLFNQGHNSAELIRLSPQSRDILRELIDENSPELWGKIEDSFNSGNFNVIYGIITHNPESGVQALPLFSRLSLRRVLQTLGLYRHHSFVEFIMDASPKKGGREGSEFVIVSVVGGEALVESGPLQGARVTRCPRPISSAAEGARFKVQVSSRGDGTLYTHHAWPHFIMRGINEDDDYNVIEEG